MPFGVFADSINERVEPSEAAEDIYVGLEHLAPQNLHIRRWGKGSDVIGTKLRFRKGDIIFGRRRAYQRKLAVTEFDGICSAHAMVVRAKSNMVLPEFLPFLMMSDRFMNRAVEISVGSLSPTINWKTLRLEEFDLPPLDQQRRLAEILWVMDETLERWRDSACCYDSYYQIVSDTLLRKDSSQHTTQIDNYSWQKCIFGDAATLQRGHDLPVSARIDGDIPIWGSNGICGFHSEAMYDGPGVITGRSGTIGEVYYTSEPYWPLNTTLFVKDFHGNNPRYIYYLLNSLDFKKYSAGSAVPTLNRNDVHPTPLWLPDLSDQLMIVEALDELVRNSGNLRRHIEKSKDMMNMLLERFLER
ncbi:MAG: restriction endonuclease subunit S [Syntrophus sp. (in: bacteria)]